MVILHVRQSTNLQRVDNHDGDLRSESRSAGTSASQPSLAEVARRFLPRIRGLARKMELARRLDDELVDDLEAAGLFSVIVPKRWGGAGLGPHELNEVMEIIATGDVSTAWVTGFYNLHNWFLCRYPLEVQEELFAGRASVRCAAILSLPGSAERVGGRLRVNGRWGYATGMLHASHALVPVTIDGEMFWVILPERKTRDHRRLGCRRHVGDRQRHHRRKRRRHPGELGHAIREDDVGHRPRGDVPRRGGHETSFLRVDLLRSRHSMLAHSTPPWRSARDGSTARRASNSPPRIERPHARVRWVNAFQTARVMHMVRDHATEEAIEIARRGTPQTLEEEASRGLHGGMILRTVRETLRDLVDGNGSSGYRSDNTLRRMSADIAMLSTHAVHGEYDVMMDRYARWLLGMGLAPGDPGARMT